MMGIEDELYAQCDLKRKINAVALLLLWKEYERVYTKLALSGEAGEYASVSEVLDAAAKQIKFEEDFPKGVKHGDRCTSTFARAYSAAIKCNLPAGHEGTHRGDGIRWEAEERTCEGYGKEGSDD